MSKENHLFPLPNIPYPSELLINSLILERWIASEKDPQFALLKRKVASNIRRVSFPEFSHALTALSELFNPQERYAVVWNSPHKSNRWVTELLRPHLSQQPFETFYTNENLEHHIDYPTLEAAYSRGIRHFCITDDAIYSGQQLKNSYLRGLRKLKSHDSSIKITVLSPYISQYGLSALEEEIQTGLIDLKYCFALPTVSSILNKDDRNILQQRGERLDVKPIQHGTFYTTTLTYFDHKVPDEYSFAPDIADLLGWNSKEIARPYSDQSHPYYQTEEGEYTAYQQQLERDYPETLG